VSTVSELLNAYLSNLEFRGAHHVRRGIRTEHSRQSEQYDPYARSSIEYYTQSKFKVTHRVKQHFHARVRVLKSYFSHGVRTSQLVDELIQRIWRQSFTESFNFLKQFLLDRVPLLSSLGNNFRLIMFETLLFLLHVNFGPFRGPTFHFFCNARNTFP